MQSRPGSRSPVIDLVSVSEARALVLDEEPTQQGRDGIFPMMRIISGPPVADAVAAMATKLLLRICSVLRLV
jgi:hypothetical protein